MYNSRHQFYRTPAFSRNNSNTYINSNIDKTFNTNNYFRNQHYNTTNLKSTSTSNNDNNTQESNSHIQETSSTETRSINNIFQIDTNEALFEIFGLKIFLDDLLIICILLFLYQEGIQDQYLFISLVLLLLS